MIWEESHKFPMLCPAVTQISLELPVDGTSDIFASACRVVVPDAEEPTPHPNQYDVLRAFYDVIIFLQVCFSRNLLLLSHVSFFLEYYPLPQLYTTSTTTTNNNNNNQNYYYYCHCYCFTYNVPDKP